MSSHFQRVKISTARVSIVFSRYPLFRQQFIISPILALVSWCVFMCVSLCSILGIDCVIELCCDRDLTLKISYNLCEILQWNRIRSVSLHHSLRNAMSYQFQYFSYTCSHLPQGRFIPCVWHLWEWIIETFWQNFKVLRVQGFLKNDAATYIPG